MDVEFYVWRGMRSDNFMNFLDYINMEIKNETRW